MFQKLVIIFKISFNLHLFLFFNWHHIVTFLWSQKFVFSKCWQNITNSIAEKLTFIMQTQCFNFSKSLKHRVQYQNNEYLIKFWNAQLSEILKIPCSFYLEFLENWKSMRPNHPHLTEKLTSGHLGLWIHRDQTVGME